MNIEPWTRLLLGILTLFASVLFSRGSVAAEPPERVRTVGMLTINPPLPNITYNRLGQELAKLGFVEGKNLVIEVRHGGGNAERLPELAAELVRLKVDVIYAITSPAVQAARSATATIPIVGYAMHGSVESGLVSNLRRPGGNVTGTDSMSLDTDAKRLELFRQIVPGLNRLAVLYDTVDQGSPHHLKNLETAGKGLGLTMSSLTIGRPEDFAPLFAANAGKPLGGIYPLASNTVFRFWPRVSEFALANRLPTLCEFRQMAVSGCLLAYGPSLDYLAERNAAQIDKILRGTPPGELPVERPSRFELVINLKTAKSLGLTVPQELLLRADEVIQ